MGSSFLSVDETRRGLHCTKWASRPSTKSGVTLGNSSEGGGKARRVYHLHTSQQSDWSLLLPPTLLLIKTNHRVSLPFSLMGAHPLISPECPRNEIRMCWRSDIFPPWL